MNTASHSDDEREPFMCHIALSLDERCFMCAIEAFCFNIIMIISCTSYDSIGYSMSSAHPRRCSAVHVSERFGNFDALEMLF